MQPDSITLSVNADNDDGTTPDVDIVYSRYDEYQNRSVYIAADHSLSVRNTMGFYRTFPKPSGNFLGVAKSAIKFTQDYVVPGADSTTTITAPGLAEVNFSLPVGITPAQTLALAMRVAAAIVQSAILAPLTDQLSV